MRTILAVALSRERDRRKVATDRHEPDDSEMARSRPSFHALVARLSLANALPPPMMRAKRFVESVQSLRLLHELPKQLRAPLVAVCVRWCPPPRELMSLARGLLDHASKLADWFGHKPVNAEWVTDQQTRLPLPNAVRDAFLAQIRLGGERFDNGRAGEILAAAEELAYSIGDSPLRARSTFVFVPSARIKDARTYTIESLSVAQFFCVRLLCEHHAVAEPPRRAEYYRTVKDAMMALQITEHFASVEKTYKRVRDAYAVRGDPAFFGPQLKTYVTLAREYARHDVLWWPPAKK